MGRIAGIVTLDLQQLDLTPHGGEVRLFGSVGLAEIGDFIATGLELRIQAILRQIRHGQALFQQRRLGLGSARPALQLPGQHQQRQRRTRQPQQCAGQVHSHSHSCH
ncbi:hypothetical protein D3C80_1633780 [compost metagenome]